MNRITLTLIALSFCIVSVTGCAQQPKAADAQQAINQSESMGAVEA